MKKTNVMIDVSDEIYTSVVEPYKRRKAFGNLVVTLLEAYAENDSIYNYINGVIDKYEDEATEELLRDLNLMADSLSMFGALSDQAESVIDNGQRAFDEFSAKAQDDLDNGPKVDVPSTSVLTREDVVTIVEDSMGEIKGMLQQLLSGGMVMSQPVTQTVAQTVVEQEIASTVVVDEVVKPLVESVVTSVVEEASSISAEDEEFAKNALSTLMGSLDW